MGEELGPEMMNSCAEMGVGKREDLPIHEGSIRWK
jgi:hypothetical protein